MNFKRLMVSQAALDCVARSGERIEVLHRRHLGGDSLTTAEWHAVRV